MPGPLKPWTDPSHVELYVAVDNTQQAFQTFQGQRGNWNLRDRGEPVLTHGPDGCGKTALIHRCAYDVRTALANQNWRVEIIDRSADRLDGQTIPARIEDLVAAILRQLRYTQNLFPPNVSLPQLTAGMDERALRFAMQELSSLMMSQAKPIALVVIPPPIELSNELKKLIEIVLGKGIVLLMETSNDGVRQVADDHSIDALKRRTMTLGVGTLSAEHGVAFVDARMNAGDAADRPKFDIEGVRKYMGLRGPRVTIRELERVCLFLFEEARTNKNAVIDYAAFASFYIRRAQGVS